MRNGKGRCLPDSTRVLPLSFTDKTKRDNCKPPDVRAAFLLHHAEGGCALTSAIRRFHVLRIAVLPGMPRRQPPVYTTRARPVLGSPGPVPA